MYLWRDARTLKNPLEREADSLVYVSSILVTLKDYQRRPLRVLWKPVYVDSWSSRELTRSPRNPIY